MRNLLWIWLGFTFRWVLGLCIVAGFAFGIKEVFTYAPVWARVLVIVFIASGYFSFLQMLAKGYFNGRIR
jgi:hypothetical protein